ncbi:hypothetical protein LJK88_06595 [Paenibacillus sp. P26]|nr:hypothetical protein LJK88_06595 [Paenibacillus sp. P26]UUZ90339.1 hypothetical protein LJK87_30940 [Paenibacillus sp. P25]
MQGTFINHWRHDEWLIRDAAGKEYEVQGRGVSSQGVAVRVDKVVLEGEYPGKDFAFRIPGLAGIPERLTLVRKVIDRTYRDVSWSTDIKERR